MDTVALMLFAFFGYVIAYHTYGRFLARKVFGLSKTATVPARQYRDDRDFVPTRRGVIFGHHFTSIAGTGPIVGPAIGIIWGWVPAMLWVFVGSIVMGGVHDLGTLVMSLRNQGKSISEITARYISPRVRYIFFLIVFLELLIVLAIFGLVIATIFDKFPHSLFPIWMQIPIAVCLGWVIYRRRGNLLLSTALAVALMYATIWAAQYLPWKMPAIAGMAPTGVWTIVLLVYAFIASTLPVTLLLQPRDYINAWQLYIAMALLVTGAFVAGFSGEIHMVAPAFNLQPADAPPLFPFLFITIACGAISGFHSLVSSGTSSKQLACETDAQFVGYGAMLTEGALATLMIIVVAAGIGMAYHLPDGSVLTGTAAWNAHYYSWNTLQGLGTSIHAVVEGSSNIMATLGIPPLLGTVLMGVFIASFAGTTLDTAARIQRYVVGELFSDLRINFMAGKYTATGFAVFTAAALAFATGADGKGALSLWPLFGAVNQLLAALALLLVTIYLRRQGGFGYLFAAIPCLFMLVMTIWSVIANEVTFIREGNPLLGAINGAVLVLSLWMVAESARASLSRPGTPRAAA